MYSLPKKMDWRSRLIAIVATTAVSASVLSTTFQVREKVFFTPKEIALDKSERALNMWLKRAIADAPYSIKWRYDIDVDMTQVKFSVSLAQFLAGQRAAQKDLDLTLLTPETISALVKSLRDDDE